MKGKYNMLMSLFNGNPSIETIVISLFAYAMVLLLIQPVHECAHALVAYKMGDDTAKEQGRLTVNPFKHLDPAGTVLMLIFGFGWGKPVPIDPSKFRKIRLGIGLSALAGPVSNLLAAFAGIIGFKLSLGALKAAENNVHLYYYLAMFFDLFTTLNIGLAVFNFIPVSPLDGDKVLFGLLPEKLSRKYFEFTQKYRQFMPILLCVLMFTPALDYVRQGAYFLLNKLTFFLDGYAGLAG